ncbi:MAG: TCR/Tet family MFS transporter [Pikeienuella sp.]
MTTTSGRSPAIIFILVTVTINSMGIGLMMPVMPGLMLELTDKSDLANAALWSGYMVSGYALMQFLFSPTLGNLSDRFGRRPVLMISLSLMTVDYLVMALTPSLSILIAARLMAGAAAATFSTANAYIADISTREKRAANFGLTGAAFGLGFVFGPAIGGYLGDIGPRIPFFAAAALTFCNLVFGYFVLPESLKNENRRPFDLKRANPLGIIKQIRKFPTVAWFLAAIFLYDLAHYVYPAIWHFFAKENFGWGPSDIGLSLMVVGIGFAVVQGYLIRKMLPRLGEAKTALLGLVLNVFVLVAIALSTEGWMIYALVPITSLSAIVTPALQGLMANRVPDNAQGELQGAVAGLAGLAFVFTPLIMTQLFAVFTDETGLYFPGAPFFAAAVFSALAIIPFMKGLKTVRD